MMMMLVETVCEKTTDIVGGQEKTDEENNGTSRALKGGLGNLCKEWKEARREG